MVELVRCFIWCSTRFDPGTVVIFCYLIMICLRLQTLVSFFADDANDATCHKKVSSYYDCQLLQNDLNSLYDYGQRW